MLPPTVSGDYGEYIRIDQHEKCGRKTSHALTFSHTLAHCFLAV